MLYLPLLCESATFAKATCAGTCIAVPRPQHGFVVSCKDYFRQSTSSDETANPLSTTECWCIQLQLCAILKLSFPTAPKSKADKPNQNCHEPQHWQHTASTHKVVPIAAQPGRDRAANNEIWEGSDISKETCSRQNRSLLCPLQKFRNTNQHGTRTLVKLGLC